MVKHFFDALKKSDTRIYSVKKGQLLKSETISDSLGFAYLPPFTARNINLYAQEGQVYLNNRPAEFYFGMVPAQPFDRSIQTIEQQVHGIRCSSVIPTLDVFVSREFVPRVINAIGAEKTFYWPVVRYHEAYSKLYELWLDRRGAVWAKLTDPSTVVFLN